MVGHAPITEPVNVLLNCGVLYFHFCWGLGMCLFGCIAIIARLPIKAIQQHLRPWHGTIGQCWIYGMLVQISTSTYCRADGFQWFIFGFLIICVGSMIVGHACIRAYQRGRQREELEKAEGNNNSTIELSSSLRGNDEHSHPVSQSSRARSNCIPMPWLIRLHAVFMCLSYSMLFGAGVMFSTRSKSLRNCQPFYAVPDCLDNLPTQIYFDGEKRIEGGRNCSVSTEL